MAQGDYIELHRKRQGRRLDHEERARKKEARSAHLNSAISKKVRGLKAKQFNKKRYAEKADIKKKIKQHGESSNKQRAAPDRAPDDAVPAYLLDREGVSHAKVLSNSIKQKRKEKAGKWNVPIPKVRPVGEDEVTATPDGPHGRFTQRWRTARTACASTVAPPSLCANGTGPAGRATLLTTRAACAIVAGLQGGEIWQAPEEAVETNGQQGHVCRRVVHAQAAQVRALHPPRGAALQEGPRHSPRA